MPGKRPRSTARRIGVAALFATAAMASSTIVASSPAVAAPSNCSVSVLTYVVTAKCTNGSGEYRAYTRCDATLWPDYNRYGAWVRAGSGTQSRAACESLDRPFNYGVAVR